MRCPDSEAPAVSTRQCHPAPVLPTARVKSSSSPRDTSQFPVTVCQEFSTTPGRMIDFSGRSNYTPDKTSPREGGLRHTEEEHGGKRIQACGIQTPSEQSPPRHVSHPPSFRPSYPSPYDHRTLLCRAESNCLQRRTGLCVSLAAGNAGEQLETWRKTQHYISCQSSVATPHITV